MSSREGHGTVELGINLTTCSCHVGETSTRGEKGANFRDSSNKQDYSRKSASEGKYTSQRGFAGPVD